MSGTVAVLDVGKTNVKLALFDPGGAVLWERSTPNRPLPGPPYLHANVEAIWSFFVSLLAEAVRIHPVATIAASLCPRSTTRSPASRRSSRRTRRFGLRSREAIRRASASG